MDYYKSTPHARLLHINKLLHHFPYDKRLRRNSNQCAFDVYLYWVCEFVIDIIPIVVLVVSLIHFIAYMNPVYTVNQMSSFHNTRNAGKPKQNRISLEK